jgi:hypothetical protein
MHGEKKPSEPGSPEIVEAGTSFPKKRAIWNARRRGA